IKKTFSPFFSLPSFSNSSSIKYGEAEPTLPKRLRLVYQTSKGKSMPRFTNSSCIFLRKNSEDRCGKNQSTVLVSKSCFLITSSRKSTPRGTILSPSRRVSCLKEKTLWLSHSSVLIKL